MKYTTSHFGAFLVVALEGVAAGEDRNLAENLFGVFTHDDVYHGRINFTGKRQFMKFLILKEYLRYRMSGMGDARSCLRVAAHRARKILENDVRHINFMQELTAENHCYSYES